jgi:hypothetical protein
MSQAYSTPLFVTVRKSSIKTSPSEITTVESIVAIALEIGAGLGLEHG